MAGTTDILEPDVDEQEPPAPSPIPNQAPPPQPPSGGPGQQPPAKTPTPNYGLKDDDKQKIAQIIVKMQQAGEPDSNIKSAVKRFIEINTAPPPTPVDKGIRQTTQNLSQPLQFNGTFQPDLEGEKNGLYLNDPDYQAQKKDFVSKIATDQNGVLLYPEQDAKGNWSNYYTKQPLQNFDPHSMQGKILQVPRPYQAATGGQQFITPKYDWDSNSYKFPGVQTPDVPTEQTLPQATVYGTKNRTQVADDREKSVRQQYPEISNLHDSKFVDDILDKNKDKNFVQRYLNPSTSPVIKNDDGSVSTHRMASSDNLAYPTIVQQPDGSLKQLGDKEAYQYAIKNKEYIAFKNDKDADWFATNGYKLGTQNGPSAGSPTAQGQKATDASLPTPVKSMVDESDKQGGQLRSVLAEHPELANDINTTLNKYGEPYKQSIDAGSQGMANVLQKTVEDKYNLNQPLPSNVDPDILNGHLNVLNNFEKNKNEFEGQQQELQHQADLLTDRSKRTGQPVNQDDADRLAQKGAQNLQRWNAYTKSVNFSQNYINQPEVKNYLNEFQKRQQGIGLIDEIRQRSFPDDTNAQIKQDEYDRKAIEGNTNVLDYLKTAFGSAGKGFANIGETLASLPAKLGVAPAGYGAWIQGLNNNTQQFLSSNLPAISPVAMKQVEQRKHGLAGWANDIASTIGGFAPYIIPGLAEEAGTAKALTFATALAESLPTVRKEAESAGLTGAAYNTYLAAKPLIGAAFMTLLPNIKFAKGFENDVAEAVVNGEANNPKKMLLNLASKAIREPGDIAHLQAMLTGTNLGNAVVNQVTNGLQAKEDLQRGISRKNGLSTDISGAFNPRQTAVMALAGKALEAVPTLKNAVGDYQKGKEIAETYGHIQNNLVELAANNIQGVTGQVDKLLKKDPGNIYAQHLKNTLEDFTDAQLRMPQGLEPEQKAALFSVQNQISQINRQMAYADPVYKPHLQKNIDELNKQIPELLKDPKKANDYLQDSHNDLLDHIQKPDENKPANNNVDAKGRQRIILNHLLDNEGDIDGAFKAAGYSNKEGFWVEPGAERQFSQLSPETKQVLKQNGVKFIGNSTGAREGNVAGAAGNIQHGDQSIRGIYLTDHGENYAGHDHNAIHELGHSVWADLPQETRDLFNDGNPLTEHGRKVKEGSGKYGEVYGKKSGQVGEEDFAEQFAKNKGDLDKTIKDKKDQNISSPKTEANGKTTENAQTKGGQEIEKPEGAADAGQVGTAPSIESNPAYRTLDYGDNKGKDETPEAKDQIEKEILNNEPVGKTGEKLSDLVGRVIPEFQKSLNEDPHNTTIVTHSSVIKALHVWEEMGRPDVSEIKGDKLKEFAQRYVDMKPEAEGKVHTFTGDNGNDIKVVRHGETKDNKMSEFREDDTQLTDKGQKQAGNAGDNLIKETGGNIPKLISSDMPRTLDTSEIIKQKLQDQNNTLVHYGNEDVKNIDESKLQARDSGEYGKGFYVSRNELNQPYYGKVKSYFEIKNGAKILNKKTFDPEDYKKYVAELNGHNYEDIQSNPDKYGDYSDLLKIDNFEDAVRYDRKGLNDYARKRGFDIYEPRKDEVVVLNSKSIKSKQNAISQSSATKMGIRDESAVREGVGGQNGSEQSTEEGRQPGQPSAEEKGKDAGKKTTGIAQRVQEKLGLRKYEKGKGWSPEESFAFGKEAIAQGIDPISALTDRDLDLDQKLAIAQAHNYTLHQVIEKAENDHGIDSQEYKDAVKAQDDYLKSIQPLKTQSSRAFSAQKGEIELDTGSFTSVKTAIEKSTGQPLTKDQKSKVIELTTANKSLQSKLDRAESDLKKATDEIFGLKTAKVPKAKLSSQLNNIAKRLRTSSEFDDFLKGPLGDVQKMGVDLPKLKDIAASILEGAAKAVKAGEDASEFIRNAVDKLKEDIGKDKLVDALHSIGEKAGLFIKETPEEKNIRRLEKQLEDIQTGNSKNSPEKRELSEREKELKEQIKDAKDKAGLVASKAEKPLTEHEKIEKDYRDREELASKFVDKKGNKFTPEEASEIYDYMKNKYLNNGVNFRDAISHVSNDTGLSFEQASNVIVSPKTKSISDAMWKHQYDLEKNKQATQRYVNEQGKSPAIRAFKKFVNAFREESVFGHGGIFVGTHAGMTLMDLPRAKYTVSAFFKAWKLAYGSDVYYQKSVSELKGSDNYNLAQRSGLKNNPDVINNDAEIIAPIFGKLSESGKRGFTAIKILRQALFDSHYNSLSADEKSDDGSAIAIAKLVNNATGASNLNIPDWINEVTFAGGMEVSRWGKLTRNPIQATKTAIQAMANPQSVSVEDRVFAKVWAKRVGTELASYTGLLVLNAAIQNYFANDQKDKVNLFDPTKPDWLKMKIGGTTFDFTSGMLSTMHFIETILHIAITGRSNAAKEIIPGKKPPTPNEPTSFAEAAYKYGSGKLSPFYSDVLEASVRHDYSGNTVPWSDEKPLYSYSHKMTWPEYIESKAPLPVAEGFKTFYDQANQQGVKKERLDEILTSIMHGAISGGTGFKSYETNEPPAPKPTGHHQRQHR